MQSEEVGDAATAAPALGCDRRGRRRPFLDPPVLERNLLTERADVDELGTLVRGVAHRPLAHQKRPLADRAETHRRNLCDPHEATIAASRNRSENPGRVTPWR